MAGESAAKFVLTVHLPKDMAYDRRVQVVRESLRREINRMDGMGVMYQGDSWTDDHGDGTWTEVVVHSDAK